jgi:glucose-6-phosphate isomerase
MFDISTDWSSGIACWPSDAGYDYSTIEKSGFSSRLLKRDEGPTLVPQE